MFVVPTRFDIRAGSDRKAAEIFLDVLNMETTEMKKIILAVAVAMVAGSPIAFAATSGDNTESGSRHCTYQGEKFDLCHQDTHKDGGAQGKGGFRQ